MEPNADEITACAECRKPIFFAVVGRRKQPLDAKPDPLGTVAAYRGGPGGWRGRLVVDPGTDPAAAHPLEQRYRLHWDTCRQAKRARAGVQESLPLAAAAVARPLPSNVIHFPVGRRR